MSDDYEIIDGIKVSKNMPKKQKAKMRSNDGEDTPDFNENNVKIRVTGLIDENVLDAMKQEAKASGMKYQTLMNQVLRKYFVTKELKESTKEIEKLSEAIVTGINRLIEAKTIESSLSELHKKIDSIAKTGS